MRHRFKFAEPRHIAISYPRGY